MTAINLKTTTDPPELAMERAEELGEILNTPKELQLIISALSLGGTVSLVTLLPVRMHNAFLVIPQS